MTAATTPADALTIYEPSARRFPAVKPYVQAIVRRRQLMWHLARTDLKAENYNTVLGQLWIILDPILMAAVYYLVRVVLKPVGDTTNRAELLDHLLMALFFFHYTIRTLNQGARSLVKNSRLILNSSIPRMIYPLVTLCKGMLDFVPTILIFFLLHWFFGQPFGLSLVFLPFLFVLQTFFTFGCVTLFAPLMVYFRDTQNFLPYVTRIWLFSSPILYTVSEIPDNLLPILRWNPLFPYFAALEQIWNAQMPSPVYLLAAAAWAALAFGVGVVTFVRLEQGVAVRL
jgi:teichoic acid transport system permease protein